VGVGWKKGVFGGVSLHMIGGFFIKIYIRGADDAKFGLEPFQTM
jgi:hypothetical protein